MAANRSFRSRQEINSVAIAWIERQHILGAVTDHSPIGSRNSFICLIEKDIYSTWDPFAGDNVGIIASTPIFCPRTCNSGGRRWRFRAAIVLNLVEMG